MALDRLSLATVPITPYFDDKTMPGATGFIWKRHGQYYLITNWHVASAKHLFTGEFLKHGMRPNRFQCQFVVKVGHYERERIEIPVRDENDEPLWLIHPAQKMRRVDIAVLRLDAKALRSRVTLLAVNDMAPGKIAIQVGMEVFILGYPFGSGPPAFPVWKRGSIASEPDLVKLTTGYYMVDTASRPGMSGSPVILRSWSNHVMESNNWTPMTNGVIDRVIGIYSGRKDDAPDQAQIGMVWHADYIDEIIDGGVRDT
jgi:hypothetical protein